MAENEDKSQKTEQASARRIRRARDQGQVALSREAVAFGALALATAGLLAFLPGALRDALLLMRGVLGRSHEIGSGAAARGFMLTFLWLCLPVIGCAALGAILATLLQTRGLVVLSLLKPQFSRLNPLASLKKMFGAEHALEVGRNLVKIVVVGAALAFVMGDVARLNASLAMDEGGLLGQMSEGARKLLYVALGAFALLAGADVLITRRRHLRGLRMSRQELKDEAKESEGDPMVKARQRMLRETRGRQRMLAAVPTATVVITNPTHYAVALRYVPSESAAPRVVAKGVDLVAERIRELAREAGVPLLPNPPLARALWKLDVDTEIPPEHWEAVAEIIAFVMRPRGATRP